MQVVLTTSRARNAAKLETGYTFAGDRLTVSKARKTESYTVAEFACQLDGRAFKLTKAAGDHYSCLIARNGQDNLCECRGFESNGCCKHVDVLAQMLAAGELDDAGRPQTPWPSPEQLAADAGEDLPF